MNSQVEIIQSIRYSNSLGFGGYIIETNKQSIEVLITYKQISNETYGYLLFDKQYKICNNSYYESLPYHTSKNVDIDLFSQKYQNSVLYNIEYNSDIMWNQRGDMDDYETYSQGFDFVTNEGTFTIGFMNRHCGLYSHNVVFKSRQLTDNIIL